MPEEINTIETIYKAENRTSIMYFKNKIDADQYASERGTAAGVLVSPVSVLSNQIKRYTKGENNGRRYRKTWVGLRLFCLYRE